MTVVDLFASVRGPLEPRPFPLALLLGVLDCSLSALAVRVGASGSTVSRAATVGLTEAQADRWAIACGLHPAEVWGQSWYALADEDDA